MSLTFALFLLPGLILGLTLHEFAHAWSASLLGDDYARRKGRVSLNPLRHLSLLGTVVLFWLGFGWARPVPVNVYNFKHPKRDYLLSSLAGPAANIVIVLVCALLMLWTRRTYRFDSPLGQALTNVAHVGLMMTAIINAVLAALNLVPLPPLDGSKIWPVIVPGLSVTRLHKHSNVAIIVLLILLFTDQFSPLFARVISTVQRVLPTADGQRYSALVEAGHAADERGDAAEAERLYTAALDVNPRGLDALKSRAYGRMLRKQWPEALDDLDGAIRLAPDRADLHRHRAAVLRYLGREEEARQADRAADRLEPAKPASRPDDAP